MEQEGKDCLMGEPAGAGREKAEGAERVDLIKAPHLYEEDIMKSTKYCLGGRARRVRI
jgi:hypothetical protein